GWVRVLFNCLKTHLQSKLDLARVKSLGDLAEGCRTREISVWREKVSVVQQVEEFGPELQPGVFERQLETLVRRKIQLVEVRTTGNIPSRIPERGSDGHLKRSGVQIGQAVPRSAI